MKRTKIVSVYSVCHFLVDFACAFRILSAEIPRTAELFLLYNCLAFAMQMPLGLLADRLNRNSLAAALGCGLVSASYVVPSAAGITVAAGLGNALFHVGGGVDVLNLGRGDGLLGMFVSPGALGIFLGTMLAGRALPVWLPAVVLLAAAAAIPTLCGVRSENAPFALPAARAVFPAALCLFLVVCLRSYMGLLFAFPWKNGLWAVLLVCGVVLGKTLGGILADRFGAARTAAVSLLLCALLFFFADNPLPGTIAVLLFNMTMPLTLGELARRMPGAKGFAFGLLTFALFLGFVPVYLGFPGFAGNAVFTGGAVLSLMLLLPTLLRRGGRDG